MAIPVEAWSISSKNPSTGEGTASYTFRRATVFVGETCKYVEEEIAATVWEVVMLSLALPPIAFGSVFAGDLCEMYQPIPMPPPMHYENR
jgi:hypothetical protein